MNDNIDATVLKVNTADPEIGKVYRLKEAASETSLNGVSCQIVTQADASAPVIEKVYVAQKTKPAVRVQVNKIEMDAYNGSKIVEGDIKGYLYNTIDLKDSIQVDGRFRTKRYKDQ